ncbi:MAG: SlyX family protein [Planctomycetota bacterium]
MESRGRIDLEERIAFQERELEQLGRVVAEQQLELDSLQREVRELRAKVQSSAGSGDAAEGGPRTLEDDRPPHY